MQSGEKHSKYIFAMEKHNFYSKNLQTMFKQDGKLTQDQNEILNEQSYFYGTLYTKDPSIRFTWKPSVDDPILTDDQKLLLETPMDMEEIYKALMSLKGGKTPGMDGLSLLFYRTFFEELKASLMHMYYGAFKNGIFPLSTKHWLISLIPKKDKDPRIIKNLRPLTLLNYSYKILAKAMDNRLQSVLDLLINQDQTGFLKDHNITSNIRKSIEIVEYYHRIKKPGMIMSIDMEKCFDRVDHNSIKSVLSYFNFGSSFIQWSMLFFNEN